MSLNPFEEKPVCLESTIEDWGKLYPEKYDKNEVDPYTKTRIILMNGTEFEATWFSHQFSRHCDNNDIRRELALMRRVEQQQQKKISNLRPLNETILETTISYEQLAVDLTCALAKSEKDLDVKNALNFALLEDFDHLYRYADLLEMEQGVKAEKLVGHYTEIMPGRPTISHHRHPYDSMKRSTDSKKADLLTNLNIGIITAAEQQTMNYYMNISSLYKNDIGRKLYLEIGMVEEQHVSQYGSLKDTRCTWLEELLMHEYTECYLYYSCYEDEKDENIKKIWEQCFTQEVAHLHKAAELLKKYENKDWQQVIPNGTFPKLLNLGPNKEYLREILKTVRLTAKREDYTEVNTLPNDYDFFKYQNLVNKNINAVSSHVVIDDYINKKEMDYRFEESPNPIDELRDRKCDNTTVGRIK
ncbi:hypothetical protein [Clostridium botulinum]|uniref:hypothetical protein n=1 Tax=Clostridium botulinum TaxID=1491 RepID=UPI0004D903D0|nr:hypothetical protein [Clostridium botulinum]KEI00136.1 hypothetical protein Z952_14235 [Clostridium botulinum C/D str. BKT75002]KEI05990.1 hypothetical protein Z954_14195 [Clostridium botulinum C/D str. BKT2873]QPW62230.1 hypothetical protein IG390_14625 [Clostridium botulinum]